jgi:hypothetical protein
MTHSSAWWGGLSGDEANNWQVSVVVLGKPLGSLLLSLSSNFSNHDNSLGFWVINEASKNINEVSSVEWISADSDDGRLSKSVMSGLINCLVGKSSRS